MVAQDVVVAIGTDRALTPGHRGARGWIHVMVPVFAFVAAVLWLFGQFVAGGQYDDSYITYRYVQNLIAGDGLVFNAGERVNSASSPMYVALLALARLVGAPLPTAGFVIGMLGGVAVLAVLAHWIYEMTGSRVVAVTVTVPLALTGQLVGWAASGMETTLFAGLITAALWTDHRAIGRSAVTPMLVAAATLTHLEGVLLLVILGGRDLVRARTGAIPWRAARAWLWWCIVPVGLWFAAAFAYYGEVIPTPVLFKSIAAYYDRPTLEQARLLVSDLFLWVPVLCVGSAAGLAMARRRRLVPVAVLLGVSFAAVLVGPYSDWARYATFLLVPMAVLTGVALHAASRRRQALVCCTALTVGVVTSGIQLVRFERAFDDFRQHQIARTAVGNWLSANVTDELVLSSDIGAVAFHADRVKFLDASGLTTRDVSVIAATDPSGVLPYIAERQPTYLADTVLDGEPQALRILDDPHEFYNTAKVDSVQDLERWLDWELVYVQDIVGPLSIGVYRLHWRR